MSNLELATAAFIECNRLDSVCSEAIAKLEAALKTKAGVNTVQCRLNLVESYKSMHSAEYLKAITLLAKCKTDGKVELEDKLLKHSSTFTVFVDEAIVNANIYLADNKIVSPTDSLQTTSEKPIKIQYRRLERDNIEAWFAGLDLLLFAKLNKTILNFKSGST